MLYSEYQKENPYKYLSWEKVGLGLGRGVVEDGFESQVWQNDAMISMKNAMELSGKVIVSTDSQKVSGNVLTGVDNGHIFQIEPNRSITSLNLSASSLPEFQNIITLWDNQYNKVASTFDANTGEAPTAGTPYSQTALLNQVANSPFEYRREEWGIFLNEILNDWIYPYLKKKIIKDHILVSDFDAEELETIDESIVNFESNKLIISHILNDGNVTQEDQAFLKQDLFNRLKKQGKKREIPVPEGFLDVEGKITANITGELKNKGAILSSLAQIGKDISASYNPNTGQYAALQDPVLSKIYAQIIEISGVPFSSSQLRATNTPAMMPAPAQPQQ